MSEEHTVTVGGSAFIIQEPTIKLYIKTIKFIAQLGLKGQTRATAAAAQAIYQALQNAGGRATVELTASLAPLVDGMSLWFILDELEEDDLVELAVLLLQSPDDSTRILIREEGIRLQWLARALRLNIEAVGFEQVFLDLLAIRKSLPQASQQTGGAVPRQ